MGTYTFIVEKTCPICGKSTRVVKTKSRLIIVKTDEDYCVHYKDFNPYYYKIWFCEHCGFAADEKTFLAKMPERQKEKIMAFMNGRNLSMEFTEERGLPEAVASYRLAIFYMELIDAPFSKRASLHLGLAWVYRLAGDAENELEFMQKAAEYFDRSIMTEHYPVGNLTDTGAIYLVGALYYRMEDFEKCAQYLSRIIGNQEIRQLEPRVYDKARDLWADVRAKRAEGAKDKKDSK